MIPSPPPFPLFEQMADHLSQLLREAPPLTDIQKNIKASVIATLERFDIVSREEFDIQTQVLARTREKLEMMEKRVLHLESLLANSTPTLSDTPSSPPKN